MNTSGGIVLNRNSQVLLIFRKGKWDLPKGKPEFNESPKITAKREVVEETGISSEHLFVRSFLAKTTYYKKSSKGKLKERTANWYLMYYSNLCLTTKPQLEEDISIIRWVDIDQIEKYANFGRCYMKKMVSFLLSNKFEAHVAHQLSI